MSPIEGSNEPLSRPRKTGLASKAVNLHWSMALKIRFVNKFYLETGEGREERHESDPSQNKLPF